MKNRYLGIRHLANTQVSKKFLLSASPDRSEEKGKKPILNIFLQFSELISEEELVHDFSFEPNDCVLTWLVFKI